jgi:hypothetical protein
MDSRNYELYSDDKDGNPNSAMMFNGSSDFLSLRSSDFVVSAYTYSLWIKPVTQSTPNAALAIGGSGGDQTISYGTNGVASGSYTKYKQNASSLNTGGDNIDGEWHHVAVVRSANVHELYIDGELIANNIPDFTTIEYGDNHDIFIGKSHRNTDYFEGAIDEVKIFDRALTAQEIEELCPQSIVECVYKESNLVARYLFSGETLDSWINNYHGTAFGGPVYTEDRFGVENAAMMFDGIDDYIDATSGSAFHLDNAYTYSAWIKPATMTSPGSIVAAGGYGGDQVMSYGSNGANSSSYTKYQSDASNVNAGGTSLNGAWHHVVAVRDATTHKLYVDGQLIDSNTPNFEGIEYGDDDDLFIGKSHRNTDFFEGAIDDVLIYDVVLSEAEIMYLFEMDCGTENQVILTVDEQKNEGLEVYPNPTATGFVSIPSGIEYEFVSFMGDVVLQGMSEGDVDVSGLNSGTYLVRFVNSNLNVSSKLVIK